jgi:hypothetical protein
MREIFVKNIWGYGK